MRQLRLLVLPLLLAVTACSSTFEPNAVFEMTVSEELRPCVGWGGPTMCMFVSTTPIGEPRLFYDEIKGFEFEAGVRQRLLVLRVAVKNPPMDGGSAEYRLMRVIARTRVNADLVSSRE